MPRELSAERCEVTFIDNLSASEMTLYYRLPTSAERIAYQNAMVTRRGNKVNATLGEARLKYGSDIFLGFKEGAFSLPGKGLISSEKGAANYDPAWKTNIRTYASDVIERLAIHVFDMSVGESVAKVAEDPSDDDDAPEEQDSNPS